MHVRAPTRVDTPRACMDQEHSTKTLVDAEGLRKILFDPPTSLRWIRDQQKRRTIPFIKLGRVVRFDPAAVRAALDRRFTIRPRGEGKSGGAA